MTDGWDKDPGASPLGVAPFVAEQFRRVEVEQDLPVRLDVAIVERAGDPIRQPGGPGADRRDIARDLAEAQARGVVEAVDVGEEGRLARAFLGEFEMWAE